MKKTVSMLGVLATLVVVAPASAQSPLHGWWRFDEPSGTVANDRSGYHNDGTVSGGASRVPGYFGSAWKFDGSSQTARVTVPDNPSLEPSSAITVTAWVKATAPATSSMSCPRAIGTAGSASYGLYTGPNGGLMFFVAQNQGLTVPHSPDADPGCMGRELAPRRRNLRRLRRPPLCRRQSGWNGTRRADRSPTTCRPGTICSSATTMAAATSTSPARSTSRRCGAEPLARFEVRSTRLCSSGFTAWSAACRLGRGPESTLTHLDSRYGMGHGDRNAVAPTPPTDAAAAARNLAPSRLPARTLRHPCSTDPRWLVGRRLHRKLRRDRVRDVILAGIRRRRGPGRQAVPRRASTSRFVPGQVPCSVARNGFLGRLACGAEHSVLATMLSDRAQGIWLPPRRSTASPACSRLPADHLASPGRDSCNNP